MIEMLVVIGVLAVLGSLLLPALVRARTRAETIKCRGNLRQLQLAFTGFAFEHEDVFPSNNYVVVVQVGIITAESWAPGDPQRDLDTRNLEKGALFPYLGSTAVFRCPTDRATVGQSPGRVGRTRSYTLSSWLNSVVEPAGAASFQQLEPKPASDVFGFVCTHPASIVDAAFGLKQPGHVSWANQWFDQPADRHDRGGTLSFLDGHIEYWRWEAPKLFRIHGQSVSSTADLRDLRRLQSKLPLERVVSKP